MKPEYEFLFNGCCRGPKGKKLQHTLIGNKNQIECESDCNENENCVAIETNGWLKNPELGSGKCFQFHWTQSENKGSEIINGNCVTTGDQKCFQKPVDEEGN